MAQRYKFDCMELAGSLGDLGTLLPMSILGVLLMFTGLQLTLTIMDLKDRRDFFVAILILGVTLPEVVAIHAVLITNPSPHARSNSAI